MAEDPSMWGAIPAPNTGGGAATPDAGPPPASAAGPEQWGAMAAPTPAAAPPPAAGPPEPQGQPGLRDIGTVAARGAIKGAVGAMAFPVDMAIEAEHAIDPWLVKGTEAVNKATGLNIPIGAQVGTSEDYVDSLLDKHLPPSKYPAGRMAEAGIAMLGAGGLTGVAERGLAGATELTAQALRPLTERATVVTSRKAQQAMSNGLKVSPAYVGGGLAKQVQTFRGHPKVHEDFSAYNEGRVDDMARSDLQLGPNSQLENTTYDALRADAYKPYEEARALTPNPTDKLVASSAYLDAIDRAGSRYVPEGESFGRSPYADVIEPEKAAYRKSKFNVGEALDHMRLLRAEARSLLKEYKPKENALGYVKREIANAIEEEVERMAEKPKPYRDPAAMSLEWGGWQGQQPLNAPPANPMLGQRLKAARTALAKIQNYEDATGAGGHIIARDLYRMWDKKYPLTGNARVIAESYQNFSKDMQPIAGAGKGERGAWSAVDYLLGGTGLATGEPMVAVASLARPGMGAALRTETVQQRMLRGYAKRAAREPKTEAQKARRETWREVRRSAVRGALIRGTENLAQQSDMDSDLK